MEIITKSFEIATKDYNSGTIHRNEYFSIIMELIDELVFYVYEETADETEREKINSFVEELSEVAKAIS